MKAGDKVRYTPIRGLNHDGSIYTIRALGTASHGDPVVWLAEKTGYVARWAVFPLERGLQSLNPLKHRPTTKPETAALNRRSVQRLVRQSMPSPIEIMIDASCGVNKPAAHRRLTDEQKEACAQLGRDVVSNLRCYYPDVVKTRPTTWPVHLRNTIARQAEAMLLDILSNGKAQRGRDDED